MVNPNVENGQIWKFASYLDGDAKWVYSYFLILDIRRGSGIYRYEYSLLPLTPLVDQSTSFDTEIPINNKFGWEYCA